MKSNRENLKEVKHLPYQKADRHAHHQHGQQLSGTEAASIALESLCGQTQNIERGETEHQHPEEVKHLAVLAGKLPENHGLPKDRVQAHAGYRDRHQTTPMIK